MSKWLCYNSVANHSFTILLDVVPNISLGQRTKTSTLKTRPDSVPNCTGGGGINFTTTLNVVPEAPFLTCGRVCMPFMCADPAPPPELLPFKTAAPPLVMEAVEMMLPVVDMLSRMWSAAVLWSLLLLPPPLAPPTLMGRQFN